MLTVFGPSFIFAQDLAQRLESLDEAIREQSRKEADGTIHVPAHLVNLKIGDKQRVMLPGRASFGPTSMARIVAKAGLFRGEEGADAATRVDQDEFYLMKLQHNKVDRGMPTLQRLACFNP
jgi:hypothetical protein